MPPYAVSGEREEESDGGHGSLPASLLSCRRFAVAVYICISMAGLGVMQKGRKGLLARSSFSLGGGKNPSPFLFKVRKRKKYTPHCERNQLGGREEEAREGGRGEGGRGEGGRKRRGREGGSEY